MVRITPSKERPVDSGDESINDNDNSIDQNDKTKGYRFQCMNSTRLMVLTILCLQNSLYTVLRRYSQGVLLETYSKVSVEKDSQNFFFNEIRNCTN